MEYVKLEARSFLLNPSPKDQKPIWVSTYCVIDGWNSTDPKPGSFFPTSQLPMSVIMIPTYQSHNLEISTFSRSILSSCTLWSSWLSHVVFVTYILSISVIWLVFTSVSILSSCPMLVRSVFHLSLPFGFRRLLQEAASAGSFRPAFLLGFRGAQWDRTEKSSFCFFPWHTPCLSARLPSPFFVPLTVPTFL